MNIPAVPKPPVACRGEGGERWEGEGEGQRGEERWEGGREGRGGRVMGSGGDGWEGEGEWRGWVGVESDSTEGKMET